MKKAIIGALVLGASVVGVALLVAVYANEGSAAEKQEFCESLTNLSSTVMSYEGLNPVTATNEERDAAADDISEAWYEVEDEASDWANAYDNELAEAYDDLYWAIDGLDGDNTTAENAEDLEDELNAFPEAFRSTFDGSGCSTTSA
jgi:hypothetical protein